MGDVVIGAVADAGGVTFTGGCVSSQNGTTGTATLQIVIRPFAPPSNPRILTSLGSNVIVDPENNWNESNEANNTAETIQNTVLWKVATATATATFTPTVFPSPVSELDLTISQSAPPFIDTAGGNIGVPYTLTVTNSPAALGGLACPTVRFGYPSGLPSTFATSASGTNGYFGTPDAGGVTFTGGCISSSGGAPMSATLTVVITVTNFGGTLTSFGGNVVVDPENAIPENNENNNTAQTVQTNISFETQTPTATATAIVTPTASVCPPTYSNAAPIMINDNAAGSPYPSNITVSGLSGTVTRVTVDLVDLTHTFPDDVDIMLVGPGGQNTLLMSDAGLGFDILRTNLTFDDAVPLALPDDTQISSGTYGPTNYDLTTDVFPAPAPTPGGPVAMGVFIGTNPNGVWSLYVRDDLGVDRGVIGAGWRLHITTSDCGTPTGTPTPTGTRTNTPTATPSETPGGFYYIQFSSQTYSGNESQTAAVTITKTGNAIGGGMNFATSDSTATGGTACGQPGVDYVSVAQPVTFNFGETVKTVSIPLCSDALQEPTETIKLNLTPNSIGGSPQTAVLNIIDTAAPTASISGRVTTASGNGIRNAKVVITGNALIEPIVATTGSFGYFSFDGLRTGETYVVTVNSRHYTFSIPSRIISLSGNVTDADFIADPQE